MTYMYYITLHVILNVFLSFLLNMIFYLCRKLGDGLFLESCRKVASQYPDIEFNDMIVDNASMQVSYIS